MTFRNVVICATVVFWTIFPTRVCVSQVTRSQVNVPSSDIDTRSLVPQVNETYQGDVRPPENPVTPPVFDSKKNGLPVGRVDVLAAAIKPGKKFPGITSTGWMPPDCDIAVGVNHIVEVVNSSIAFYTKSGNRDFQQTFTTFFNGVAGGSFLFDPKAFYDKVHNRFVMVALELDIASETSKVLVAVSDDDDPNGVWHRYRFEAKLTVSGTSFWLDYPGFGYNQDAYVVSGNMFGFISGWAGVQFLTIPSAPLLTGAPANVFSLRDENGASVQVAEAGQVTPVVYAIGAAGSTSHRVYGITNAGTANPILTTEDVTIPNYRGPTKQAVSTNGSTLDAGDGRLINVTWNNGRLLTSHAIQHGDNVGIRWYEIQTATWPVSGALSLLQTGDITSPSHDYFFPAISHNASGGIGIIFGGSNATEPANIYAAGRLASDPIGNMGVPVKLGVSLGSEYNGGRWGDYFGTDLDPVDGVTFWSVAETVGADNDWDTQIVSFGLSPAVTSLSIAPATLVGGFSATGVVTLAAPAGAAGQVVTLLSNNTAVVVPESVTVPGGALTANFVVKTTQVATETIVKIEAFANLRTVTATVTVRHSAVDAINIQKTTVNGGETIAASVSLTGTAGVGGTKVNLTSSNPAALVPSSVTILPNLSFVNFSISTFPVIDDKVVTLEARADGVTKSKVVTVQRPRLESFSVTPDSFAGGQMVEAILKLTGTAPSGGIVITLGKTNNALNIPATVVIPAGKREVTFEIGVQPASVNVDTNITASHRGETLSVILHIKRTDVEILSFATSEITGGETTQLTITLNGPAPDGGLPVALTSSHESIGIPSQVIVPGGDRSVAFDVVPVPVSEDVTVLVRATGNGGIANTEIRVLRPRLTSYLISPKMVIGGATAQGILRFSGVAPLGGISVDLLSSRSGATVPPSVKVPAGVSEMTFAITTSGVSTDTDVSLKASFLTEELLTKLIIKRPSLASLSINPSSVLGGLSASGEVHLTGPAPLGGLRVDLTTEGAGSGVPVSVTVLAGQQNATIAITTIPTTRTLIDKISAHANGTSSVANLTIRAVAPASVSALQNPLTAGATVLATVTLMDPAPVGGLLVTLSSDKTAVKVPVSVRVPVGKMTATFTITTVVVNTDISALITASANGESASMALVVRVPAPSSVTIAPTEITGGQKGVGTVRLTVPAPTGGLIVKLASSVVSLVLPPSITIAVGKTEGTFALTAPVVAVDMSAKITAISNSISAFVNLPIRSPRVTSLSVSPVVVLGGKPITVSGVLTGAAPVTGLKVSVTTTNPALVVPKSVSIASGKNTFTFIGTTTSVTTMTAGSIIVTLAGEQVTVPVKVRPIIVDTIMFTPSAVVGGLSASVAIKISDAAPAGGFVVSLDSAASEIKIPQTVTIPAGKTTMSISATTVPVSSLVSATVGAANNGIRVTGMLQIVPVAVASIVANPASTKGLVAVTLMIKLASVSSVPVVVTLASSDSQVINLPSILTIPAGSISGTIVVNVVPATVKKTILLSAKTYGSPKQINVVVVP